MNTLLEAYRFHRRRIRDREANGLKTFCGASYALKLAREDVAKGERRYTESFWHGSPFNPWTTKRQGEPVRGRQEPRNCRWVDDTARAGLRSVGASHEVARANNWPRAINHTGWFTRDDGWNDETVHGSVYQYPARNGRPFFVYGYDDPNNPGAAFLCFANDADDAMEAATWGDSMAESYAEAEREYSRAWDAGRKFEDLGDEIKAARKTIRELAAELRRIIIDPDSAICRALRGSIVQEFSQIERAREKRAELLDEFGRQPGFVE